MSSKPMGVNHTLRFRPASVSRNFADAPRVEDPVANTRSRGKWSAAIFNNSEGLGKR